MGAGCTISSSNKNFLAANVSSPINIKKPSLKPHEQTDLNNKADHNEMLIPNNLINSQHCIDSPDYYPNFNENQLKNYQIGKYLTKPSTPPLNFWTTYLQGVIPDNMFSHIENLFLKNPNNFALKIETFGTADNFRWESWYLLIVNASLISDLKGSSSHEIYKMIISKECKCEEDIKKDLFRTFPRHPFFIEIEPEAENRTNILKEMSENMGNIKLYRVLKAIANYYPNVGYCQGMNFLVGFFLALSGGKECQVFELLIKLAEHPRFKIFGFYENGFPLLRLYCFIFYKILEKKCHKLAMHLKEIELPDSLWLTKWILTMLVYSFPFEINVKLWDFIIGNQSLFNLIKICCELIKIFEKTLLVKDCMEIADFFREIIENKNILLDEKSAVFINPEKIVKKARKIKLNDKMIGQYTRLFINTLEKDEEKNNPNLIFYKEFGVKKKVKKTTKNKKTGIPKKKLE